MKAFRIFILSLLIFLLLSCSWRSHRPTSPAADYEKKKLACFDEIQRSVLKVACSAYYENFYYNKPTVSTDSISLDKLQFKRQYTTNSVSGTALILQRSVKKLLLLSCYHIFNFQDSIKVYYPDNAGNPTKDLYSLSVLFDMRIFVTHKNSARSLGKLLSSDSRNDLALFETDTGENTLFENALLSKIDAKDKLEFGKKVYLIGFPKGFLFITEGLINPSPIKNRFLISAPFNHGFSGGVVIAFDENSSDYSCIGIANSMPYDSDLVLTPSNEIAEPEKYFNFPYNDDIFIKEIKNINYGITFAIKGSVIYNFIKEEQEKLKLMGHHLPDRMF